jgi:hypothetical protein
LVSIFSQLRQTNNGVLKKTATTTTARKTAKAHLGAKNGDVARY